jgi:hypothetical protein
MRILCLDLSTHTGYAVFDGEMGSKPTRVTSGTIDLDKTIHSFGPYPHSYRKCTDYMAALIYMRVAPYKVERIVVEEINSGRDRYVQKLLENIHTSSLTHFDGFMPHAQIVYLNSDGADGWRTNIGLTLSKEQKRANARLSKAKRESEAAGVKLDKKKLGVKGKTNKKHLAVERANAEFGLKLKQKDNNEADALCLGLAFFNNCTPCDGVR